jgi:Ca2+:H+ antiporter
MSTTPRSAPPGSTFLDIGPAMTRLLREPFTWLLLSVPLAAGLAFAHLPDVWIFLAACLAIIPLAGLMGRATENLAETMGSGIGGLLNATFGNAAELIIALAALWSAVGAPVQEQHQMIELVKASITGSIIGNILLVLGLSILAGGVFHKKQIFNRTAAGMGATLLALAAFGLLIPTLYFHVLPVMQGRPFGGQLLPGEVHTVEFLSEEIAGILALIYLCSLLFSLRTHQHLFAGPEEQLPTTGEFRLPEWNRRTSLIILVLATAGVAWMSHLLIDSVSEAAESLGMTKVFIGVIVVAVVGNAAEHSTAVLVAMKNKMDLAFNIAVGSSLQIALFVAPFLVFASMVLGLDHPLDLHFTIMETVTVLFAVFILALITQDGETHWMEGVMLLGVYAIIGLAFYHLPDMASPK